jgi:outer membrane protein TolC
MKRLQQQDKKMMKRTLWMTALLLVISYSTQAQQQDTLDINQAIRMGLENNFSIRIAENNARIAENNNSIGNAGFLPTVTADASLNKRVQDNTTNYSSDALPDRNDEGVETTVTNYGVDATWTVFDGLTMFATADRLDFQADISQLQAQMEIEQVLADIISTYFQVVGQQQAYHVLENTLEVSQERIRIAETKLDLGSGSEYDLLQARADFNADRAALIRAGTGLKQAKVLINQILANSVDLNFDVQANIELSNPLELQSLLESAITQNSQLTISRLNESVAEAEIREITGEWFPQISLGGGYRYNKTESSVGFSEFNETEGFNYGVTARINLFDGMNKSRRRQNAQIELKNEQLRLEEQELFVSAQIRQIYEQYSDALELIALEQENLQYTQQSLDIALERFRLGTINSVELREAQLSLLNAENRLISAQIEAKAAETELLRLSGRMMNTAN